jgi:hypothetical protein
VKIPMKAPLGVVIIVGMCWFWFTQCQKPLLDLLRG